MSYWTTEQDELAPQLVELCFLQVFIFLKSPHPQFQISAAWNFMVSEYYIHTQATDEHHLEINDDSMRSRTHQVRSRLIGWVNIRPSQACNACTTAHIYCNARSRRFSATSNQNVTAWYIAGQLFRSHTSDALNKCTYTWIIYQSRLRRVRCNCKQASNAQLKYMTWGLSLMINPPCNDMTRLDLDNQTRSLEVSTVNCTMLMLLIIPPTATWLLIDPSQYLTILMRC